jgi:hypothetical protein
MEAPCYRCGAPVEEQTTFCPACGAPQIKVTAKSAADQPSTLPLPPGTPASLEPPALPLHFAHTTPIAWKKFLRSALPLCVMAGFGLAYTGLIGVIIFFGLVAIMVVLYQRRHPAPLSASQGARMGALAGVLSFIVVVIATSIAVLLNPQEARQQWITAIQTAQQRSIHSGDPQAQQVAKWFMSSEGIVVALVFGTVVTLVLIAILSSAVGAITASLSSSRQRR